MKTIHFLTLECLSFALLLSGCGAYEAAQEAARSDLKKAADNQQLIKDASEAIMHVGAFYVHFHRENSRSPANVEELLSVTINREQRAADAVEIIQRMVNAGEIEVDWNVDLTAWQASGQDLKRHRLATHKTTSLFADGTGMIRNLQAGELISHFGRMNELPQQLQPPGNVAATDATGQSPPGGPATTPTAVSAPAVLTLESAPAEFAAVLKTGQQGRVLQALGLLTGKFDAKPDQQVSDAIIATMKTGDFGIQTNGLHALEKWGTGSAAAEVQSIVAKSGNPGLEFEAKRIVGILKARAQ